MRVTHIVFVCCLIAMAVVWFVPTGKAEPAAPAAPASPPQTAPAAGALPKASPLTRGQQLADEAEALKVRASKLEVENLSLKYRIEQLERQNQELQKAMTDGVRKLTATTAPGVGSPPVKTLVPSKPKTIPPNAIEREFNGTPYYLIPLGTGRTAVTETISSTAESGLTPAASAAPADRAKPAKQVPSH